MPAASLEKASTFEGDYRNALRASARAFWVGEYTLPMFVDSMVMNIRHGFGRAWIEGASLCGIAANEIGQEEHLALNSAINTEIGRVIGYSFFIQQNAKAEGGKLNTVFNRTNLWAGSYAMIKNQAMMMACADRKLEWVWNPLKEHCSDCRRLNGKVYRASTWRKYEIYPRMWRLRCRGKYCGCEFHQTDKPVTPGRPPVI